MTIIHLPVFCADVCDSNAEFFAQPLVVVLFSASFFSLASSASAFLRATIFLGLPPSVNNCDINLKGLFFLRLNGMRK